VPLSDQDAYGADPSGRFLKPGGMVQVQPDAGGAALYDHNFPRSCAFEDAPCVTVCPDRGQPTKRVEDGIVLVNEDPASAVVCALGPAF